MIPTLWQRFGLWMNNPVALDPVELGQKCGRAGVGWIAPQVANEGVISFSSTLPPWLRRFHDAARSVGGHVLTLPWAVCGPIPRQDAELASVLFAKYGASGMIFDAERWHKGDEQGDWGKGDQHRSDDLVAEWKLMRPKAQIGLSTYGAASDPYVLGDVLDDARGPMHFRCWYYNGQARLLPQAYENEQGPVSAIPAVMAHAARAHWPRSFVHPTIGTYTAAYAPTESELDLLVARQLAELRQARVIGFSAYLADQTPAPVLDRLLAEIRPAGTRGAIAWR